jgi:hypothetical protein
MKICLIMTFEEPVDYVQIDPTQKYLAVDVGSKFQIFHLNGKNYKLLHQESTEEKTRKIGFVTEHFVRFTNSNRAFLYELNKHQVGRRLTFYCEREFSPVSVSIEANALHLAICVELSHGWEPLVQRIPFEYNLARFGNSRCLRRERRLNRATGDMLSTEYFDHVERTIEIEPSSYAPPTSILLHVPWIFLGHKDGSVHLHRILEKEIIEYDVQYEHFSKVTCLAAHKHRLVSISRGTLVLWEWESGQLSVLHRINIADSALPLWCAISLTTVQVIYLVDQLILCTYSFQ